MYPVHLLFYLRCILKLKEVRRSKTPVHIRRLCNCIIAYPSRRNVKSAPRQHHPASSTLSRVILFTFSIQAGMSPTGSATAGRSCQVILLWSICLPKHPEMRPIFYALYHHNRPFYSHSQTGSFVLRRIVFRASPDWFCLPRCEGDVCSLFRFSHCDQARRSASPGLLSSAQPPALHHCRNRCAPPLSNTALRLFLSLPLLSLPALFEFHPCVFYN